MFGRKLESKLDYLQNFNYYLLKCLVGKLLISCSGRIEGDEDERGGGGGGDVRFKHGVG